MARHDSFAAQSKLLTLHRFPPDTEEKQKRLGAWFGDHGPQEVAEKLPEYVKALSAANPSINSWAILGVSIADEICEWIKRLTSMQYCWGGKVVELATAAPTNPFAIAAVAHPAMIEPSGAEKITVPYLMLASGDDPEETVQEFKSRLKVPHHVEVFADQVHGWMAARGDLLDDHVRDEYIRGYRTILSFFRKHWV